MAALSDNVTREAIHSGRAVIDSSAVTRSNPAELWRQYETVLAELRHRDGKVGPLIVAGFAELALLGAAVLHRDKLFFDPNWGFLVSFLALFSATSIVMGLVSTFRIWNQNLVAVDKRRGRSGETPVGVLQSSYLLPEDLRRSISMARPPSPENKEAEYRRLVDELQYRSSRAADQRLSEDLAERIVDTSILATVKEAYAKNATFWLFWGLASGMLLAIATMLARGLPGPQG